MIVVTTKIYYLEQDKRKPITRNQYIWANSLIIDDIDDKCPVIEG
tara:strand:+ start:804 stop:938 length:135 start_codon:yes stop_codon:yes gene_type:complete